MIVGLARKELLDSYETLFAEAGIPIAAVTFSPAVIHSALRIWSVAPASLLCFDTDASNPGEDGRIEMYGESESRVSILGGILRTAGTRAGARAG